MQKIKNRNMLVQVLLMIVTFGLYGIYWFHQIANEMKEVAGDQNASPTLWTVLLFIPFGALYSHYKFAELFERVASDKLNKWILYILWFVFVPAVWFIVQSDMNRKASGAAGAGVVVA